MNDELIQFLENTPGLNVSVKAFDWQLLHNQMTSFR
jgi:hypothetical protein